MHWLNYGGGVNSTALLILMCERKLEVGDWRILWSDVRDEKDETYAYVADHIEPYLLRHYRFLEKIAPAEGVFARWWRIQVVGSRTLRSCTVEAKIRPIERYLRANGAPGDVQIIGIDAGEERRAKPALPTDKYSKLYPLVELGIDRDGCVDIIERAGLPVPPKSGCWHCPFVRVGELRELFNTRPDRFAMVEALEARSIASRPLEPVMTPVEFDDVTGEATRFVPVMPVRAQWGDKPATTWRKRFEMERAQGTLPFGDEPLAFDEIPCGCFDGEAA